MAKYQKPTGHQTLAAQTQVSDSGDHLRVIINAILYVTKTGGQWRMLPNDYPNWELV